MSAVSQPGTSSSIAASDPRRLAARAALATLAYTAFVILFGAVVRITGSGAGCGQHWPTCHGEIAHLPRSLETLIELTHRVTSGGALVMVLAFAWLSARAVPSGHRLRSAAYAAVALMIFEALLGAALVLFELVGGDASTGRAVVMPLHLVSTYALTAALALGLRFAARGRGEGALSERWKSSWFGWGALALVVVSATGALTALGDTVYPPSAVSLDGRLLEDHGAAATFLQRLRIVHPVLAVLTALWLARRALAFAGADAPSDRRVPARALLASLGLQLCVGIANVLLGAPGYLQVVHLACALALWIAFVTLAAAVLEVEPQGRASG